MREIHFSCLREIVQRVSQTTRLDAKTEMYIRIYVLGTVHLTCEWILGNYSVSPKELAEVYENSLPEPLRQYFC